MINGCIIAVPGFKPSFSLFELLIGILDCFTCSTNCDLIIHICCFLSIRLWFFYWRKRKWTFIAEKHPVWKSQNADSAGRLLMGSHVAVVLCCSGSEYHSTESSHAFGQNWDTKQPVSSIYSTISCETVLNPLRLNPPCLNPSYLRLRFLRTIQCGVCLVFCFFAGSLTSTLVWPDWFTKRMSLDFSLAMARSWSNVSMRVLKSLW